MDINLKSHISPFAIYRKNKKVFKIAFDKKGT